jgi:hypothetical protein
VNNPQSIRGKYLVVRQFGQTSIRWARSDVRSNRWFRYVRFYEIRSILDDYSARILQRKLGGDDERGRVMLWWFTKRPFLLDLLLGRPRLYVADTWQDAVMKAGTLELDEVAILGRATSWMPRRVQRPVMSFILATLDGFVVLRAFKQALLDP